MKKKIFPEDTDPAFAQALEERRAAAAERQRIFDRAASELARARRLEEKRANVQRRVKQMVDEANYQVVRAREERQARASRSRFRAMETLQRVETLLTKIGFERRAAALEEEWRVARGFPKRR